MKSLRRGNAWTLAGGAALLLALACSALSGTSDDSLRRSREAAVGAPRISTDFPIVSPTLGVRNDVPIVASAFGAGNYLLVFRLTRGIREQSLVGVRVRASDGAIFDPSGFGIAQFDLPASVIAVVATYAGDHWLVAYQGPGNELHSVSVANDGVAGAPTPLGLSPASPAALVWGGTRALLTTRDVRGQFLSGGGAPLGSSFDIHTTMPRPSMLDGGSAAFDGTSYLVASSSSNPATVRLFSVTNSGPTGKSIDAYSTTRSGTTANGSGVTTNGTSFLASYTAPQPSCAQGGQCAPTFYYRAATVAANGNLTLGAASQDATTMASVHTNGSYLLWERGSVLRVDANGTALGPSLPLLNGVSNAFFSAFGNSAFGMSASPTTTDLLAVSGPFAIRVSTALAALDSPPLAPLVLPKAQTAPAAAFDGTNYVVGWVDSGRGGIRASRVSLAGGVLDTGSFAIANAGAHSPVAASNGSGSLFGWLTADTLGMARVVNGTATPVDVTNLQAPFVTTTTLASNGSDYLAVWTVPVVVNTPPAARAARIPASGAPSAPITFSSHAERPAVAFDGMNYVVVQSVENGNRRELLATRIAPNLNVLDAPSRLLLSYGASNGDPAPLIASNGSQSLVVWFDGEGGLTSTIRCARVARDLTVLDPNGVTLGTGSHATPGAKAVWDGTSYWVLWEDRPDVTTTRLRLYGRRLTADAVPIDSAPFLITSDLPDMRVVPDLLLGLVRGATDELLLASVSDDPVRDSQAVRARFLSSAPAGGTGGGAGVGGAGTGGTATGGAGTGGTASGGAGTGGTASGGAGTGGTATGGAATGGTTNGGEGGEGGGGGDDGGGMAGEAGAPSTGGRGGTSGSAGSGGSATGATGGSSAGRGGSGTTGGSSGASSGGSSGDDDDSGCSCSVPRSSPDRGLSWVASALMALALRRRRR